MRNLLTSRNCIPCLLSCCLLILLSSCSSNLKTSRPQNLGPPTVSQLSTERSTLEERIAFIEQYVTFRRSYLDLEYDVFYQNNGGGLVSGPSDWDIRILAVVPSGDVDDWISPQAQQIERNLPEWLDRMPGTIATRGINEWYADGSSVIGIDRAAAIILYWNTTIEGL